MNDFETFILDPANRAAAAAARAVADASGLPFAPLLVVGPPGSGKTELLLAITARVKATHPGATIELLDPAALAERYHEALRAGRSEAYRARLAGADLLLIDDAEGLARQRDGQGLVADVLDARRSAGREVVLTMAAPPETVHGLDARLVRRIAEGARVDLAVPGHEARIAILRRRLGDGRGSLPDEVVMALADADFPSMRDYTGALARLLAFQEASPVPLSPEEALLLIGVASPAERPEARAPEAAVSGPPEDEFGLFLSEVTASLTEQVDRWRRRIGEAIVYWGGEGLRTRRLEALLEEELAADPDPILAAFARDAHEIQALEAVAATVAPDLAGAPIFRDPDQLVAARALVEQARSRAAPLSAPLPQFRWEDLAESPANRLALMAGRDIIAEPGRRYSPLVVTGRAGVGKSHFLHGLGNALASRGVVPVACLGSAAFAAEVPPPGDEEGLAAWRRRYAWAGAFLLDDLHLLAGDPRAQEELGLLAAELIAGQRQMVVASLRPPEELSEFDPRLVSLLQGGLTVELPAPDREVRLTVVKRELAGGPGGRDAALADYLAGRPVESIRALLADLRRVLERAKTQRVSPSPAFAREVLEVMDLGERPRRSGPQRRSGVMAAGLGLIQSREKVISEWPALGDRLSGDLR